MARARYVTDSSVSVELCSTSTWSGVPPEPVVSDASPVAGEEAVCEHRPALAAVAADAQEAGFIAMWEEESERERANVYGAVVVFWLVCGLVMAGAHLHAQVEPACQGDPTFTYYDLVLQRCNGNSEWTLHGLWPSYNASSWPQYCYDGPAPAVRGYERLRAVMAQKWSSCDPSEDESFWRHEYLRHGTCSDYDTPYRYFSATLGLYDTYLTNGTVATRCHQGARECIFRVPRHWSFSQWLVRLWRC